MVFRYIMIYLIKQKKNHRKMSEFLYDKAIMALKAQRYDEAQASYEQALQAGYSVEAWTGLGICKMFQIAEGQTMEEVLYCFEKARKVEGADNREIDLKLLQNAQVVILQCAAYAIASINNAIEAEKKAATAALISIASIAVGGLSNSIGTKIFAGAAAATAAGVAVGQFGKMTSSKEIAKFATDLLEQIYNNVYGFLLEKDKMEEAVELKETTDRLCNEILETLPGAIGVKSAKENEKALTSNPNISELATFLNGLKAGFNIEKNGHLMDSSPSNEKSDFKVLGTEKKELIESGDFLFVLREIKVPAESAKWWFSTDGIYEVNRGVFNSKFTFVKYNDLNLKTTWTSSLKCESTGITLRLGSAITEMNLDWPEKVVEFIKTQQSL